MIDPNHPIPVTLNAVQWNIVLSQLDEGPHRMMRPLIDAIRNQCMTHDTQGYENQLNPLPGQIVPFQPQAGN